MHRRVQCVCHGYVGSTRRKASWDSWRDTCFQASSAIAAGKCLPLPAVDPGHDIEAFGVDCLILGDDAEEVIYLDGHDEDDAGMLMWSR